MRTFPALLLTGVLVATTPAAVGQPADPDRDRDPRGQQTSDGVRGRIAVPIPEWMRTQSRVGIRSQWDVAPGVRATVWDERDKRGPTRLHLLQVDLDTRGIAVDYANAGAVRRTAPVSTMLARNKRSVGGVNGDFFDIGDTGAPLGVGRDRQRGVLNGPRDGWNNAFYLDAKGRPEIGVLPMVPLIKGRPGLRLTNVNSPSVRPGGIGVYTRTWGRTSGHRIVDGQQRDVRMVLIRRGKVVANRGRLRTGQRIQGTMLVARGPAVAKQLRRLKRGKRVNVRWRLQGRPRMAITGNRFLVNDGLVKVVDDREMHPRTAIGIDRATNQLLLLVVDGRQGFSRGYTMVELARKMIWLGADEALNLDGGGSSTMLALREDGGMGLLNSPSDGAERRVANAIEVSYTRPRARR